MDSPPPSRKRALSWQDSGCRWSCVPHRLLHIVGLGTIMTQEHLILCWPIWTMDSPGVLPQTLFGGTALVTLFTRIPGALDEALLMIPQHLAAGQQLITIPTRELLTPVHIHVLP